MRARLILALTGAALLAAPAGAQADAFLSVQVARTGATAISMDTGVAPKGGFVPLVRATLSLAPGFRFAPRATCAPLTVRERPDRCPASSRVGGGSIRFAGFNPGARAPGARIDPVADVAAYAGAGATLQLRASFARPFEQVLVYTGRVAGRRLVIPLDQGDIAGYEMTPAFMRLVLGGPNGAAYVRRPGGCPQGGFRFAALLRYRSYDGRPPLRPRALAGAAGCGRPAP